MDTYFRTINESSSKPLSDRFVVLAEKCLSLDNPLRERLTDRALGESRLGECVYQYRVQDGLSRSFQLFDLQEYPEKMLSDIKYISYIMLFFLQRIDIIQRDYVEDLAMEPLGEYHRDPTPFIVLFPKEIRISAKNGDMDEELLAAMTLIHELSHAFLDPGNYDGNRDTHSATFRQYERPFMNQVMAGREKMNFYHIREESMANIITCRVFMMAAKKKVIPYDSVKKVKSFISSQPDPYRLALSLLPTPNIWGWVKAKTGDPLSEDQAFEWMKEAEAWLSSNPDGKGYGKIFLIKEKGPWAVIEESDADSFFAPNHMIKRGDYYFLYDTSWNLIFATPVDSFFFVSKSRFLIQDGMGCWKCLDKSGQEAISVPSDYSNFNRIQTRADSFLFSATRSSTKDIVSFESGSSLQIIIAGISDYKEYDDGNLLQIWGQNGLTGFFDMRSRQYVLPAIYEECKKLRGTLLFKVKKCGKYGIYNLSEKKFVCKCIYDAIDYVKKDPLNRSKYQDCFNLLFLVGTIQGEEFPIDCEPIR